VAAEARNQHSHETVLFHPMPNRVRVLASLLEERFPPFRGNKNTAPRNPATDPSEGHQRIQRHPRRMLDR